MIDLNQEVIIDSGQSVKLGNLYSDKLLIYFYPKDMTSGCTKQALLFQEQQEQFDSLGCKIVGVSRDSIKRHNKFKQTYGLTFDLIADEWFQRMRHEWSEGYFRDSRRAFELHVLPFLKDIPISEIEFLSQVARFEITKSGVKNL